MKKIIIVLFSFLFLLFPSTIYAQSQDNFLTSVNSVYTVKESGTTHVLLSFKLKNKSGSYYASSYTIGVGFNSIDNLHAFDQQGSITPVVKKEADKTTITLNFNGKVAGTGNVLPFTVSFDTQNVATKVGNIWEVTIPGIINQEDFESFNVHIDIPPSFGKPAYIKPQQLGNTLDFTKAELHKSGIFIGFGDKQIYHFNLTYHITNKDIYPIQTEIALPPTTNYQEVSVESIQPKPTNVIRDKDGNWLAQYYLLPLQKTNVIVSGSTVVSVTPKEEQYSDEDLILYLQEKPYWQTSNKQIQQMAQELKTPAAIYNYVTKNLTYDFSRGTDQQERSGAAAVLNKSTSAVCLEFTDLFIALSRAAGIPAREVDGYAYTQNTKEKPLSLIKDILHAWPEYYDKNKKQWIMVDPTWGNTTGGLDYFSNLDFDHFAFVIKGVNSIYPIPAGGYKLAGQENIKDVQVTFANTLPDMTSHLAAEITLPKTVLTSGAIQGTITLKNTGNAEILQQKITVISDILTPKKKELVSNTIPPFGNIQIPILFDKTNFLTNQKANVTILFANQKVKKTIVIYPILSDNALLIGGGILVSITIIIFIITTATRRISISRSRK